MIHAPLPRVGRAAEPFAPEFCFQAYRRTIAEHPTPRATICPQAAFVSLPVNPTQYRAAGASSSRSAAGRPERRGNDSHEVRLRPGLDRPLPREHPSHAGADDHVEVVNPELPETAAARASC